MRSAARELWTLGASGPWTAPDAVCGFDAPSPPRPGSPRPDYVDATCAFPAWLPTPGCPYRNSQRRSAVPWRPFSGRSVARDARQPVSLEQQVGRLLHESLDRLPGPHGEDRQLLPGLLREDEVDVALSLPRRRPRALRSLGSGRLRNRLHVLGQLL